MQEPSRGLGTSGPAHLEYSLSMLGCEEQGSHSGFLTRQAPPEVLARATRSQEHSRSQAPTMQMIQENAGSNSCTDRNEDGIWAEQ